MTSLMMSARVWKAGSGLVPPLLSPESMVGIYGKLQPKLFYHSRNSRHNQSTINKLKYFICLNYIINAEVNVTKQC